MSKSNFKIAVSTGLHLGRNEELATVVRKVGYALTRGSGAIEIGGDVPHEVDYSEGREIRYIAKKQKIDINFHGSLTIPFCIPEMVQWQEADDHIHKSLKSAVYAGANYIDFHACQWYWLEMLSYVGARFEIVMCDWMGRFINRILYKNETSTCSSNDLAGIPTRWPLLQKELTICVESRCPVPPRKIRHSLPRRAKQVGR